MNAPQPTSPRRRLQALLAIPDSQRTEAEWDELNELEISLAPGNRAGPGEHGGGGGGGGGSGGGGEGGGRRNGGGQNRGGQNRGGGGQQAKPAADGAPGQAKKPARKFHKRPAKPKTPGPASAA